MRNKQPGPMARRPTTEVRQEISGPQELLIGQFVVAWSRLDHSVDEVIWSLLRSSVDDGRVITARLDLTYKFNLLRGLAQRRLSKDDLGALFEIIKKINDLNEFRVLIIHGLWVTVQDTPAVQSMRGKLPEEAGFNEVVTTEMPRDLMQGLINNTTILMNYLIDCRKAFYASPDKPVLPPWTAKKTVS
jgi:hypothetical protein